MEISESAWAKAKAVVSGVGHSEYWDEYQEVAEAIARAIDKERRECAEIVEKVASDLGSGVEGAGSYWNGVLDSCIGISQAIRNK